MPNQRLVDGFRVIKTLTAQEAELPTSCHMQRP
jgi:hypothetical protein